MNSQYTNRREFLKRTALAGIGISILGNSLGRENNPPGIYPGDGLFSLPQLPYAYDALEPFIDKQTMELHHGKHHQAYVNNLNKELGATTPAGISVEIICKSISKHSLVARNNAGGHYNHSLFWKLLRPNPGSVLDAPSPNLPYGKLGDAIKSTFDSADNFNIKFTEASMKVFGSGWAWLVIGKEGKLEIGTTPNQDNPLMDLSAFSGHPVLALDVWEHAYYLKYQNKRADYIANWWKVVNWEEAGRRFEGK